MSLGSMIARSSRRLGVISSESLWLFAEARLDPTRFAQLGQRARALQAAARHVCRTHGVRAEILGELPARHAVLVANHQSYLDPLVLVALTGCLPIVEREHSSWPMLGPTLTDLGVLFTRRDEPTSRASVLRRAATALTAGVSVLNFPEGNASSGDYVRPFHRGIFGVAQRVRVPVVPVALRFGSRGALWDAGSPLFTHYLRVSAAEHMSVRLAVGEPLHPRRFPSPELLAEAARDEVDSLLCRL
jgi:1-acyl-sn-glycerol-3-phosphate acyltransferase